MTWVAIGLNPSVLLGVTMLAIVEMFRSRQWLRWPIFGAVWLAGVGSWLAMASWFPSDPGPIA